MADFVYDGTPLPGDEWNSILRAIADLRDAVLSGDYHGLVDSTAAISAAGGVRLRSSKGRLQVSQGGVAYWAAVQPGRRDGPSPTRLLNG
jgi:hypothetical protein